MGPDLVRDASENVELIRKCLFTAQSRQKSYTSKRRLPLEFKVVDHVFLKVMPERLVVRFGKGESYRRDLLGPSRYSIW